jgi:hypothetical protein
MTQNQSEDAAQLRFRVDKHLRDRLEQAAEEHGVSLNKEIAERLTRSLEPPHFDETRPHYGILRLLDQVMNAAGESALFARTHSWEIARRMSWLDDGFAYEQAMTAAGEVLKALKPAHSSLPEEPGVWDGKYWAEWFLKMVATGKPNVPENQAMVTDLRSSLGALTERLAAFADIDPSERPHARARAHLAKGPNKPRSPK